MTSTFLPFPLCGFSFSNREFSECVGHMKVNLVWVTAEIKTVSFCSPGCPEQSCLNLLLVLDAQESQLVQGDVLLVLSQPVGIGRLAGVGVKKMAPTWTLVCNPGVL